MIEKEHCGTQPVTGLFWDIDELTARELLKARGDGHYVKYITGPGNQNMAGLTTLSMGFPVLVNSVWRRNSLANGVVYGKRFYQVSHHDHPYAGVPDTSPVLPKHLSGRFLAGTYIDSIHRDSLVTVVPGLEYRTSEYILKMCPWYGDWVLYLLDTVPAIFTHHWSYETGLKYKYDPERRVIPGPRQVIGVNATPDSGGYILPMAVAMVIDMIAHWKAYGTVKAFILCEIHTVDRCHHLGFHMQLAFRALFDRFEVKEMPDKINVHFVDMQHWRYSVQGSHHAGRLGELLEYALPLIHKPFGDLSPTVIRHIQQELANFPHVIETSREVMRSGEFISQYDFAGPLTVVPSQYRLTPNDALYLSSLLLQCWNARV